MKAEDIKKKAYEKIAEVLDELHPEQRGVYMHGFFDALAFFEKVLNAEE